MTGRRCALLRTAGRTYAEQAGIRLTTSPPRSYRLLVLSVLLSTRSPPTSRWTRRRSFGAAEGTPGPDARAGWQQRVDALGRARYKRYDESTATAREGASVARRYRDDLRRLREGAERDPARTASCLTGFPARPGRRADIRAGGPGVGPELRPRSTAGAGRGPRAGPVHRSGPARGAGPAGELATLAAALVRVALDKDLARQVRDAA